MVGFNTIISYMLRCILAAHSKVISLLLFSVRFYVIITFSLLSFSDIFPYIIFSYLERNSNLLYEIVDFKDYKTHSFLLVLIFYLILVFHLVLLPPYIFYFDCIFMISLGILVLNNMVPIFRIYAVLLLVFIVIWNVMFYVSLCSKFLCIATGVSLLDNWWCLFCFKFSQCCPHLLWAFLSKCLVLSRLIYLLAVRSPLLSLFFFCCQVNKSDAFRYSVTFPIFFTNFRTGRFNSCSILFFIFTASSRLRFFITTVIKYIIFSCSYSNNVFRVHCVFHDFFNPY